MTDDKKKDIVTEVFGKSEKADDRVSALFTCLGGPGQFSLQAEEKRPSKAMGPSQLAAGARNDSPNGKLSRQAGTVAAVGLIAFALLFLAGRYLRQYGNAATQIVPEEQHVSHSETVSPSEKQPSSNVQHEPVSTQREPASAGTSKASSLSHSQQTINWGRLLDDVRAAIPESVQLSVLESDNGSEMFLEGKAISTHAVHDFVQGLSTNKQIKSAGLARTSIEKLNSQNLLTFSINCDLVSEIKTPGGADSSGDTSGLDKSKLLTPKEAEEFFADIKPVSRQTGCIVKSLLISPNDALFEDTRTETRIRKEHAILTLLGSYQNILKAVEKLQDHSQGVRFDSVSIKQGRQTGRICTAQPLDQQLCAVIAFVIGNVVLHTVQPQLATNATPTTHIIHTLQPKKRGQATFP